MATGSSVFGEVRNEGLLSSYNGGHNCKTKDVSLVRVTMRPVATWLLPSLPPVYFFDSEWKKIWESKKLTFAARPVCVTCATDGPTRTSWEFAKKIEFLHLLQAMAVPSFCYSPTTHESFHRLRHRVFSCRMVPVHGTCTTYYNKVSVYA